MLDFDYVSPFGVLRLWGRKGQLYRVELIQRPSASTRRPLRPRTAGSLKPFVRMLDAYFEGEHVQCDPGKLLWNGTSRFEHRVYDALMDVPYGRTASYAQLARLCGSANAFRAVGNALGRNPLPVFVPCHRIVRADGALGGFTAGLTWKRKLLTHEGHVLRRGRLVAQASAATRSGG